MDIWATFRKKAEINVNNHTPHHPSVVTKPLSTSKKKKSAPKVAKTNSTPIVSTLISQVMCSIMKFLYRDASTIMFLHIFQVQSSNNMVPVSLMSDGHMTPEEVERHLESRQTYLELVPEKAPPTVPTEMFSNDPSLDR